MLKCSPKLLTNAPYIHVWFNGSSLRVRTLFGPVVVAPSLRWCMLWARENDPVGVCDELRPSTVV